MRLLKFDVTGRLNLTEDFHKDIPRYAILSHTWGRDEDEVTFDDLRLPSDTSKAGYNKIRFCGEQAGKDGLEYFWVDTCCINKSDRDEYSKSINSMYRWYRNAERCYVYLSDVSVRRNNSSDNYHTANIVANLRRSRWFTRGWTLQELIAPSVVEFYSQEGELLGSKETFEQLLSEITEVPITALRGVPLTRFTLDERIQWAARRDTKKPEDQAYCLFGILNLFLPVFYGEGGKAIQRLKSEFDRSKRSRRDLDKMPYVSGAMYNSNDMNHEVCHPATRVDLLNQIRAWALDAQEKSMFWLNGMAGTGKSTISLTVARWLAEQGHHGEVDLGASFFFKRGEGDRGKASQFFLTIARSLGLMVSGMDHEIANEITTDFSIYHKALGEQFDKLIYRPLQKVKTTPGTCPILVVVVDALDECENESDIEILLDLWSRLPQITSVRLKLFLTSRPELPIRLKFSSMAPDVYRDMILQDAVPRTTIQQDITVYFRDQFSKIREDHNVVAPQQIQLAHGWPGRSILNALVDMAVPLFIVAATVCRFMRDPNWDPQEQLEKIQELRRVGDLEQMEQTYLPILNHLHGGLSESRDRERLYNQFRTIVGAIICLAEPLSATSLATLLHMPLNAVVRRLYPLHSVLQIPADLNSPIRTLHLSFPEFLLSDKCQQAPFGIDGPATHRMLLTNCLNLLSGSSGLRENLCNLQYPGQRRHEVDRATLDKCLPPAMQYACRYLVHHVKYSMIQILDDDEVHQFLQTHFLHWVEALSFMDKVSEMIQYLAVLESVITVNDSECLVAFLEDARRVVLANRYIVNIAPLQIYSSAMIFAPQSSMVRKSCGRMPQWLRRPPITPQVWGPELQTLEGHTDGVSAVAISRDGTLLASGSWDKTVRLWDPRTGRALQTLEGHTDWVSAVAISRDGTLLASGSDDSTVRLWDPRTGRALQTLEGHRGGVSAVAISRDGTLLASGSRDSTVRLWDPRTGRALQTLEGHTDGVNAVAISRDGTLLASGSYDSTVRLWDPRTGRALQTLEGHRGGVSAVAISRDGTLLASGSWDSTVRLWDPRTGRALQTLEGHRGGVSAVAISRDGTLLASGSDDSTVRLWDPRTGRALQTLEGHRGWVRAVAISRDGTLLASGSRDSTVRLWDPRTGRALQTLEGHRGGVSAVAISRDGTLLASGSWDSTVRLWDPRTGRALQTLEGHRGGVSAVAISRDGTLLASGSWDSTVRLWDPRTGRALQTLEGHRGWVRAVAISRDGTLLASGSRDSTVRLWDPRTGRALQTLEGHRGGVSAVAISRDGTLLASGSWDNTVRLWDPRTGRALQTLEGHTDWVSAVAISRDGTLLASGSHDSTVRLWDPRTGRALQTLEARQIESIAFSSDKNILLTNRGVIPIAHSPVEKVEWVEQGHIDKSLKIRTDWIKQGEHNVLWLPHEYRSNCVAFHGGNIAIGLNSGRVAFIEFESSR